MSAVVVYLTLALINFLGSIIQGVAGMGDAILLQVMWYIACEISPGNFKHTPLGPEPVAAVALLMYVRLLFMAPLVVYLSLSDGIFSKSMTIMMAIPSTIVSIIGVIIFKMLDGKGDVLKLVLGLSSLFFALVYACILGLRVLKNKRSMEALKEKKVKVTVEAEAIKEEAKMSRNQSFTNLQASFVQRIPNLNLLVGQLPARANLGNNNPTAPLTLPEPVSFTRSGQDLQSQVTNATDIPPQSVGHVTGFPVGTQEVFVSTITRDPFVAQEAAQPQPTEDNVPPLSPSKLSPSRTMTYTRVRVNRNLDDKGKIKMSTKVGAAVAASVAGLMASLTGVNAPPQIIFILLYDAPNYIVRVNFSAQSIPSNIFRFAMAVGLRKFTADQIPIFFVSIVFGYTGVFVGNAVGRLLGPKSFNLFVLCLLLLSSLVMVTSSVALLMLCTIGAFSATAAFAYWENVTNKPILQEQQQAEMEIEKRMYDVMEELQRSFNANFLPPSQQSQNTTAVTVSSSLASSDLYNWRSILLQHLNANATGQNTGVCVDNDDGDTHHKRTPLLPPHRTDCSAVHEAVGDTLPNIPSCPQSADIEQTNKPVGFTAARDVVVSADPHCEDDVGGQDNRQSASVASREKRRDPHGTPRGQSTSLELAAVVRHGGDERLTSLTDPATNHSNHRTTGYHGDELNLK